MARKMVFREGNEFRWSSSACAREDLVVHMAGEVLYPYLAEAGFGGNYDV